MALRESQTDRRGKSSSSNLSPGEFAAAAKIRVDAFMDLQAELLNELQESNRRWFDRAHSAANLASDFAAKLTAAHSIPEAMTACQEWTAQRFEMMAEDSRHLLADTQKFMETGARFMSNGRLPKTGMTT